MTAMICQRNEALVIGSGAGEPTHTVIAVGGPLAAKVLSKIHGSCLRRRGATGVITRVEVGNA